MSWTNKAVTVTGAGGFIGSHLTEALVEAGARVRALVHYNALGSAGWLDHSSVRQDVDIVAGDITDRDCVERVVAGSDVVFHLAALIGIPYSYQAPAAYVRTNIEGTLNVVQAGQRHGVQRIVHTSTSETYGTARYVPMDEAHPLQGQSPYSASKIGADKVAESFYLSFGVPVVTVRPFNTFGPRQSERAVIPTLISQCLTQGVMRVGNANPTRDFSFVANTVSGFMAAGSTAGVAGETFNLGTGREISVADVAALIAAKLGVPVRLETDPQRKRPPGSEVERLLADIDKARRLLGWSPSISLEEGLNRTIDWMRARVGQLKSEAYQV